ncbi:hypothetical protein EDD63_1823 [Breznakia blatticola]|uniref:Uncharacterized protein n=1 Tax=Breznakia blatticola TaxID=1754012 RepID=A0A4R7Z832_9FIRM|nr:hypothetical protein [Breznakia blatticola]TDW07919.1 hypothetical protein EDD63_1823 [Breznakia blatticola]
MMNQVWYVGSRMLVGDDAISHMIQLRQQLLNTKKMIHNRLDEIRYQLNGYEESFEETYVALYQDVMELGEACSIAQLQLEMLIEEVEKGARNNEWI